MTNVDRLLHIEDIPAAPRADARARLPPLDGLRGLIIIVMALDHANAFIAHAHPPPELWSMPTAQPADALAFLTRFVTHFAAPGFFFLMGAGMALFAASRRRLGWSEGAIVRHLMLRGFLLIALQLLVENPAWQIGGGPIFTPQVFLSYFGVLYGLGAALIAGSLLLGLRPAALLGLGLAATLVTELVIIGVRRAGIAPSPLAQLLMIPGRSSDFTVYYPLIPWLGVALFGMAFGRWLVRDPARAFRGAALIGLALLALFAVLRLPGGFGNLQPAGPGWIGFLNVVKYPPSMVFLALTLGVDMLLLALLGRREPRTENQEPGPRTENKEQRTKRPKLRTGTRRVNREPHPHMYGEPSVVARAKWLAVLGVYGGSPLFFYIAHLYLYGLLGLALAPREISIPRMYPFWLLGLAILYPLCQLYGRFKRSREPSSMWRLF
ncbi:MAG: DUF1624 domain-containing protein [Roseiflexaceae bacterium]